MMPARFSATESSTGNTRAPTANFEHAVDSIVINDDQYSAIPVIARSSPVPLHQRWWLSLEKATANTPNATASNRRSPISLQDRDAIIDRMVALREKAIANGMVLKSVGAILEEIRDMREGR